MNYDAQQVQRLLEQLHDISVGYIDRHTGYMDSVIETREKIVNLKNGITMDKIKERVQDQKILNGISRMNSTFITECVKLVYDKYISIFEEYHNKLVKGLSYLVDDFKFLEQRATFVLQMDDNNLSKQKGLDDVGNKMRVLADKMNRDIRFYSYDSKRILQDLNIKYRNVRAAIDSHIEKMFANILGG